MSVPQLRRSCAALCCALGLTFGAALPAMAENGVLGFSTLGSNDALGDGADRWQTATMSASFLYGPKGSDGLPQGYGEMWEVRSGFQIATPADTQTPAPGDRAVAGVLRSGLYNRFARGGVEYDLGLGLEAVGPVTRVIGLQDMFHSALGFDRIAPGVIGAQVPNRFRAMAHGEVGYAFDLAPEVHLRPFVSGHYGLERYGRAGFDISFGEGWSHGVFGRDYVTGQRYQIIEGATPLGVSVTFGADVAGVMGSDLLANPTRVRGRLRGGLLMEDKLFSAFYGVTYLTPEFTGQPGGQMVGSYQLQLKF